MGPEVPWTASVLRKCIPRAFENAGKPMGSPVTGTSLYKELESAVEMTAMLCKQLKVLMESSGDLEKNSFTNELIEKAKEKVSVWEDVLKRKPATLKNANVS